MERRFSKTSSASTISLVGLPSFGQASSRCPRTRSHVSRRKPTLHSTSTIASLPCARGGDDLAARLDSLSAKMEATGDRFETSAELEEMERRLSETSSRVDDLVGGLTELRASVESLSTHAVAREQAEADAALDVDDRISSVRARGDDLAARLDSLSAKMEATGDRFETKRGARGDGAEVRREELPRRHSRR